MARTAFLSAIVLAMCGSMLPVPARGELSRVTLNAGMHLIHAEVADTAETRARGLMFRESLEANAGMLFVFPQDERHCMWMRNTRVALSVAFIDATGRIINIADMQPHSEKTHCAVRPARYALEMTKGWFASRGISAGVQLGGLAHRTSGR